MTAGRKPARPAAIPLGEDHARIEREWAWLKPTARLHETAGVFIGRSVPYEGGFIFQLPDGRLEWTWGYVCANDGRGIIKSAQLWLEAQSGGAR